MILGRSPNAVIGALGSLFNVIVAFHIGGFAPSIDQIATVNAAILAVVLLIANTASIQIAAGNAAATRASKP